jgi:hypothetical protein
MGSYRANADMTQFVQYNWEVYPTPAFKNDPYMARNPAPKMKVSPLMMRGSFASNGSDFRPQKIQFTERQIDALPKPPRIPNRYPSPTFLRNEERQSPAP